MVFSINMKTLGLICVVLILLFVISAYKRPSKEYFENLATLSFMESRANQQLEKAFRLQDNTKIALNKCKKLGLNIPDHITSFLSGNKKNGNYVIENFESGILIADLAATVNTILTTEVPKTLTPTEVNEAEKAKVDIANAIVATEEAKLANVNTELAKAQLTSDVKTIQDIPVTDAVKSLPEVQVAAAKVEEKSTDLQKAVEDANTMTEKAKQIATDTTVTQVEKAEAQKSADMLLAKAATVSAEVAQAKLDLATIISKLDTNSDVQKEIQTVLETDKKAVDVAKGLAAAAESRAQVSTAEANVATLEKKTNEAKTPEEKKLAMDEWAKSQEEFRQKVLEDNKRAAEAQKKSAEAIQLELERQAQQRKEENELSLYANKMLNASIQKGGFMSSTSDAFRTASLLTQNAKSKEEIDSIIEKAKATVLEEQRKENEKNDFINKRADEIMNAAASPLLYFTQEELQSVYKIPDENEYQKKKAEIIAYTQKKKKENLDKLDEENNRRIAESTAKVNARMTKLMAMTPVERYQNELNEVKEEYDNLRSSLNKNMEDYKAKVISNLINSKISLPKDVVERLKKLPTYKEFDEAVKEERIKRESATQKLNREAEEVSFEAYKQEKIDYMLNNTIIYDNPKTINELKNATNKDQFYELSELASREKRMDYLAKLIEDPDGSKAQFAKNMEPIRITLLDQAYSNGFLLDENQYKRLKDMSINTPEKFQSFSDEIKKTQRDIVDAREAESKRKREAEEKARQDAILAEKKAKEEATQKYFLERRATEVNTLVTDPDMPISKEMEQDLLNTNDRTEFYRKVDIYKEQSAGGVRQVGESLSDFLLRRQKELETERLKKNQTEREKYLDKENYAVPLDNIVSQNQAIIDSTDPDITQYPREEAKFIIKFINDLKAKSFPTHKDRYNEYANTITVAKAKWRDEYVAAAKKKREEEYAKQLAERDAEKKRKEEEKEAAYQKEYGEKLAAIKEKEDIKKRTNIAQAIYGTNFPLGISSDQYNDLIFTPRNENDFKAKMDEYMIQAAGGKSLMKSGEDAESFYKRRNSEESDRRAEERGVYKKYIDDAFLNNTVSGFTKEEVLQIYNRLKAKGLSDKEVYTQLNDEINRIRQEKMNEQKRIDDLETKSREDWNKLIYDAAVKAKNGFKDDDDIVNAIQYKFNYTPNQYTKTMALYNKIKDQISKNESIQKVFKTKDSDDNDVKFFRLFRYDMKPVASTLSNKTAQECVDEAAKNTKVTGFLRNNVGLDDKDNCYLIESSLNTATPTPGDTKNLFARYDQVRSIPNTKNYIDTNLINEANTNTNDVIFQAKERNREKYKGIFEKLPSQIYYDSQVLEDKGRKYLVVTSYRDPLAFTGIAQKNIEEPTNEPLTIEESYNIMKRDGAKGFARLLQSFNPPGPLPINTPKLQAYLLKNVDLKSIRNSNSNFATFIPFENLPAEFNVSGFRDYSSQYSNQKQYVVNQNAYLDRSSRAFNYSMFHPAL